MWNRKIINMGYTKEMIERLIHSHANLYNRLNKINNRVPQPPSTQRVLREARILNEYFADGATEIFIQNKVNG